MATIEFTSETDADAILHAEQQSPDLRKELWCLQRPVKLFEGAAASRDRGFPVPPDEARRLALLPEYDLFGTAPELQYDQVTKLAAELLGVPICLISIIGEERQWLKSRTGLDVTCTPRSSAFCAHTIMGDEQLVVLDAAFDPRFKANPLVTGPPRIRFYAGAPLIVDDNIHVGALCLIDQAPHEDFTPEEGRLLKKLASIVAEQFKRRRQARLAVGEGESALRSAQGQRDELSTRTENLERIRTEVRAIVADISALARQSKMLAMNAAIEAAHAGDAGGPFSAVAGQAKELAEDTRLATLRASAVLEG